MSATSSSNKKSLQPAVAPRSLAGGPMPLYHQLELDLVDRIRNGEFKPGDALPTEEQIGEQYSVSRITVRRALDSLLSAGRIHKRRGVGTFVSKTPQSVRTVRLRGSLDEFLANAGALSLKLLSFSWVKASVEVSEALGVDKDDKVVRIELVSMLKNEPVIYLETYFPEMIGEHLNVEDITPGLPIIQIVERKLKLRIVRALQYIEPDIADSVTAGHLGLVEGVPVLRIQRVYHSANGEPVEVAILRHHPQRYEYIVELNAGLDLA